MVYSRWVGTSLKSGSRRLRVRERLSSPQRKRDLNLEIFAIVAARYDTLTRVLSFGRDAVWKAFRIGGNWPKSFGSTDSMSCPRKRTSAAWRSA